MKGIFWSLRRYYLRVLYSLDNYNKIDDEKTVIVFKYWGCEGCIRYVKLSFLPLRKRALLNNSISMIELFFCHDD